MSLLKCRGQMEELSFTSISCMKMSSEQAAGSLTASDIRGHQRSGTNLVRYMKLQTEHGVNQLQQILTLQFLHGTLDGNNTSCRVLHVHSL